MITNEIKQKLLIALEKIDSNTSYYDILKPHNIIINFLSSDNIDNVDIFYVTDKNQIAYFSYTDTNDDADMLIDKQLENTINNVNEIFCIGTDQYLYDNLCLIDKHNYKLISCLNNKNIYTINDILLSHNIITICKEAFIDSQINSIFFNQVSIIEESAFKNNQLLETIDMLNVIHIGPYAFEDCTSLKHIKSLCNVEYIGECAFSNCLQLTHINLPNTVSFIGKYAFNMCEQLNSINLFNTTITELYSYTFKQCEQLQYIELPKTLKVLHECAFKNCYSLQIIYFKSANNIIKTNITEYDSLPDNVKIIVPDFLYDDWHLNESDYVIKHLYKESDYLSIYKHN